MKNVIFLLASVLMLAFAANGAAPSGETVDANYIWDVYNTISSSTVYDTVAAAADSVVLLNRHTFEPGWQYILVIGTPSQQTTNEMIVRVHCLDASGAILYTVADVDTIIAAGKAVLLPIGESAIGHQFTVQLLGGAAHDGRGVVNRAYVYRRRCITGTQARWR